MIEPDRPLRVAALAKQIPVVEDLHLDDDGRLIRDGLELHMNDYCRRAVRKGIEIAEASGGTLTVITMGPPSADTVLREAIACGAHAGIHVCDPACAGSDTWATAKTLAAAIEATGPFDLILCGRNAVDADTGQVPPELAEFLGMPFVAGVRELSLEGDTLAVGLEHDDEWVEATVALPAVVSCAERLCDPCKIKDPAVWATVDATMITLLAAADLGPGPWGAPASPTSVGEVRQVAIDRENLVLDGSTGGAVSAAVVSTMEALVRRGALVDTHHDGPATPTVPTAGGAGPVVAVCVEPARDTMTAELLGAAATLAAELGGSVVAIGPAPVGDLGPQGADVVVELDGATVEEDIARGVADWAGETLPWAILAPGTAWGREVASRVAARVDAGLTGDAVGLTVREGRLVADKPAFGGSLVAEIHASSAIQMATVRAGVLPVSTPRDGVAATMQRRAVDARSRVRVVDRRREDDAEELATAQVVIGVGQGIDPADYPTIKAHAAELGAALCATRKVTDNGWMPRARQVGITGHSIAPRLYIAVGLSGKYNHTAGVNAAGTIVAVNPDSEAPVFGYADVGIVGDWREVLEALTPAIVAASR